MFEHFDERARMCVVLAQEEALRLGHEELGTVHLLLGVAGVDDGLLGIERERVRAAVVALHGSGRPATGGQLPLSAEAKGAIEGANSQALARGHTTIDPAHLLLALLDAGGGGARALREAGAIPSEVRDRATAAAGRAAPPDAAQAPAAYPSADLGEPATDGRLLGLILAANGAGARLLRSHGVDEARVRALAGTDDPG